jgi:hypothetical protein
LAFGEFFGLGGRRRIDLHPPDRAHLFQAADLRPGLAAGAEQSHHFGILAGEIFGADGVDRPDRELLQYAVLQDRDQLAGGAVEQQHEANKALAGGCRHLDAPPLPAHHRKGDDVGREPDRADLPARYRAVQRLELVGRRHVVRCAGRRREQIGAAAINRRAAAEIAVEQFKRRDGILHRQNLGRVLVGEHQRH